MSIVGLDGGRGSGGMDGCDEGSKGECGKSCDPGVQRAAAASPALTNSASWRQSAQCLRLECRQHPSMSLSLRTENPPNHIRFLDQPLTARNYHSSPVPYPSSYIAKGGSLPAYLHLNLVCYTSPGLATQTRAVSTNSKKQN